MAKDFDFRKWLSGDEAAEYQEGMGVNAYERALWIRTIIGRSAEAVAAIGYDLYKNDKLLDTVDDADDPAIKMIHPPWGKTIPTLGDLICGTMIYLMIDGEAFIFPEKSVEGYILKLIEGNRFQEKVVNDQIISWTYSTGSTSAGTAKKTPVPVNQIAQIKFFNPKNPNRGIAPLKAAENTLMINYYADAYNTGHFKNGEEPNCIVEVPSFLTQDQRDQQYANYKKYRNGLEKKRGVLLLEGGAKLARKSISVKDVSYSKAKEQSQEELCAVFGCFPAVVGIFRYANYANSGQQKEMWYDQTIIPLADKFCNVFNVQILDQVFPGQGYYLVPNKKSIPVFVQTMEKKSMISERLAKIGYPLNVLNDRLDMGMEQLDGGDVGYMNGIALYSRMDENKPEEKPDEQDQEQVEEQARVRVARYKKARCPMFKMMQLYKGKINYDTPFFDEYRENIETFIYKPMIPKAVRLYKAFFEAMGKDVAESLKKEETARNFKFDYPYWASMYADFIRDLVHEIAKRSLWMLSGEVTANNIQERFFLFMKKKEVIDEIGLEDFLGPEDYELLIKALEDVISQATLAITKTYAIEIEDAVRAGIDDGETIEEIANNILEVTAGRVANATTNAQTMVSGAYNTSRQHGYKMFGVKFHMWLTMGDAAVRETHLLEQNLGKPVPVGDNFPITGIPYPGFPGGPPKEVINCRCVTIPLAAEFVGAFTPGNTIE